MSTYNGLLALLAGSIDYAGIFPPASLPLAEANKKAATFRKSAHFPWLMGRVTLPWEDIKKLNSKTLYEAGADGSPWNFTALAGPLPGTSSAELARTIEWELREIRRWNERWQNASLRMAILGYEIKLPVEITHKSTFQTVLDSLKPGLDRFLAVSESGITPYFEISFTDNWKDGIQSTCRALAEWKEANDDSTIELGVKFRTGGALIPTPQQLATAIAGSTSHHLRFKATQGLHHPFSDAKDFGFVNLFAALAFAQSLGESDFTVENSARCLKAPRSSFSFTSGVQWEKYSLSVEDIETARRVHGGTFGSCSVDEPDLFLFKEFP